MILHHRRSGRMQPWMRAEEALDCATKCATRQQGMRLDDASGAALEVGQVEHWGYIEHIEYGNYVNEFKVGGGNAFGRDSGYDWTGVKR